jgi:hypothetical protein
VIYADPVRVISYKVYKIEADKNWIFIFPVMMILTLLRIILSDQMKLYKTNKLTFPGNNVITTTESALCH